MIKNYILNSFKKYPVMHTEDFICQMHQAEFGSSRYSGGDVEYSMREECLLFGANDGVKPVYDIISRDLVRVNLRPYCERGYSLNTLSELFKCVKPMGSREGMDARLAEFKQFVANHRIDLPNDDVNGKINEYIENGYKPFPHSSAFRLNYNPHYRVIYKKHAVIIPIIAKIDHLLYHKMNIIVGIDGNSCSGKSTYANVLNEYYNYCNVIRCDDFFVPKSQRGSYDDAQNTNLDYKRLREVLEKVASGLPFSYERYDCKTDSFETVDVEPKRLTIVEGSYALHKELVDMYAIKAILTVDKRKQFSRVLAREGVERASQFISKWIPQEDNYLASLDKTTCIIVDTTEISYD